MEVRSPTNSNASSDWKEVLIYNVNQQQLNLQLNKPNVECSGVVSAEKCTLVIGTCGDLVFTCSI